jgi:putative transposase
VGKIELRVPQDRQGRFRTEVFERYQRSEKALGGTAGIITITTTHKIGIAGTTHETGIFAKDPSAVTVVKSTLRVALRRGDAISASKKSGIVWMMGSM